ncbi:MAG: guanylate kinase [Cyclobacteriaceae bacterium]
MNQGKAIIFSAPSGSGKTTIVKELLRKRADLMFSVSATTRSPRAGETDKKDYYFLSVSEFKSKIMDDEMVEWEEVYSGTFYGTLQSELDRIWSMGNHVLFDVDVVGGINLKKILGERALAVFVRIPDLETLEERLKGRKSETEESIKARLGKATHELTFEKNFDISIINDDLAKAVRQTENVVEEFIAG